MEQGRPEEKKEVVDDFNFSEFYLSEHLLDVLRVAGPDLGVLQPGEVELEHLAMLPVQLLHQLVPPSLVARTYEPQPIPNSGRGHLLKWFEAPLRSTIGQASDKKAAAGPAGCHCQCCSTAVEHHFLSRISWPVYTS